MASTQQQPNPGPEETPVREVSTSGVDGSVETPVKEVSSDTTRTNSNFHKIFILGAPGLVAGLVASLLTVVVMGIMRLVAGIPTPVELFGDYVLKHIDVNTFIKLLMTFAPTPKTTPLGLALLGMVAIGTVLGLIYAGLVQVRLPASGNRPSKREWLTALALAELLALVGIGLFWNELPQNFLGLPFTWARVVTALALLIDFNFYGILLSLLYRVLLPKEPKAGVEPSVQGRREWLARAGVAALGVGGLGAGLGAVNGFLQRYTSYDGMKTAIHNGVTPAITPNSEHYVVTQNPSDPAVDASLWQLEVTGLVGHPGSYSYGALQQLPSTSRAVTLECIANGRGDHLIGTAIWQGVTLQTLLDRHGGAQPNASYIALYSTDGYNMSLPLDEVLAVDPLFAWRMNGAELPQRHGFPLRTLIPGRYGEENVKWLTRIELTDHFVGGLYSDQGWYHGPLHTMSRIDRPFAGQQVQGGKAMEVGGIAFAGNRGIKRVEVSIDNGATWNVAKLQPPVSQDSWVMWSWEWTPFILGSQTLMVRATDGTGAVQTSQVQGTVPNGATGYHTIQVKVV
jgi:DMSO/TMAO reductase YedYZ molybdopterin-dependent catalytic subunit